jgi:hypothetical protein
MDSLDAQCLIIDLVAGEIPPPSLWCHHTSGELSCTYSGGESTFTWGKEDVAEMAGRWRGSAPREVPERARHCVDAHRRLDDIFAEGGLERPDIVVHDFDRRELRAYWEEPKVVVIIDEIGELIADDLAEVPPERYEGKIGTARAAGGRGVRATLTAPERR